ncbi:MAG: TRAP transporter small permease [Rhodospirillaceae bacterium]|nr:TRAP transporter small permease [Rhodospirillaceae bacterium]MCY4236988.1 TRAP transporter small permease [Rhodospirillaceae bacterium]
MTLSSAIPETDSVLETSPSGPPGVGEWIFYRIPGATAAALGLVAIGVNFANVIGRYAFSAPIVWAEELLRYALIWIVYLGAIMVTWRFEHLSVDIFVRSRGPVMRKALRIAFDVSLLATSAIVILTAINVVGLLRMLGKTSVIMGLPLEVPHFAVLFGFAMQVLAVIWRWMLPVSANSAGRRRPQDPAG